MKYIRSAIILLSLVFLPWFAVPMHGQRTLEPYEPDFNFAFAQHFAKYYSFYYHYLRELCEACPYVKLHFFSPYAKEHGKNKIVKKYKIQSSNNKRIEINDFNADGYLVKSSVKWKTDLGNNTKTRFYDYSNDHRIISMVELEKSDTGKIKNDTTRKVTYYFDDDFNIDKMVVIFQKRGLQDSEKLPKEYKYHYNNNDTILKVTEPGGTLSVLFHDTLADRPLKLIQRIRHDLWGIPNLMKQLDSMTSVINNEGKSFDVSRDYIRQYNHRYNSENIILVEIVEKKSYPSYRPEFGKDVIGLLFMRGNDKGELEEYLIYGIHGYYVVRDVWYGHNNKGKNKLRYTSYSIDYIKRKKEWIRVKERKNKLIMKNYGI